MDSGDAEPVRLPPARLLIVEHQANLREGHYMKELDAVATAAARDGHDVHVLADGPLAIEQEGRALEGVAGVHRVAPHWVRAAQRGQRLSLLGHGRRWAPLVLPIRMVGYARRQRALVRGVAECATELGGVPTLILSWHLRVQWAVALAPRSAKWAVYKHSAGGNPPRSVLLSRLFAWRERRREADGGWVRLVANSEAVETRWKERFPYLTSVVCPLAGVTPRARVDRRGARADLGLDVDDPIALAFGVAHAGKDLEAVLLAFADGKASSRLVLAGAECGQQRRDTQARHPTADLTNVKVFDGPQSDDMKTLLHSAADFVVVSYRRHRDNDSGTLADAIGFGLPVCCSDDSRAADLVRTYRLGAVFAAEDAEALRAAALEMPSFVLREEDRLRFISDWSVDGISRRLVAAAASSRLDS
jgi:glycosyltransferase involved in cell wall biosynthesis